MASSPPKDIDKEMLRKLDRRSRGAISNTQPVKTLSEEYTPKQGTSRERAQPLRTGGTMPGLPPVQEEPYSRSIAAASPVDEENDIMIRYANSEYLKSYNRLRKALAEDRKRAGAYNESIFNRARDYDRRIEGAANYDEAVARVPGGLQTGPEGFQYFGVNPSGSRYVATIDPGRLQYTSAQRVGRPRSEEVQFDYLDTDTILPALKEKAQGRSAYIGQITQDVFAPNALNYRTVWRDYNPEAPATPLDVARDTLFAAYWTLKKGQLGTYRNQNDYGAGELARTQYLQDLLDNDPRDGRLIKLMNGRQGQGFSIPGVYSGAVYPVLVDEMSRVLQSSPMFTKNWDVLSRYIKTVGPKGNRLPEEHRKQVASTRIAQYLIDQMLDRQSESLIPTP